METRKKTTAGVLLWTPAPARRSPPASLVWEDEEQTEKEDDFVSHMDENGIIGLLDALKDMELETCGDSNAERGSLIGGWKAWTEGEDGRQSEGERGAQGLPERDHCVNMTEEQKAGLEAGSTGISISSSGTELHLHPLVFNHHGPTSRSASPATARARPRLLQETPAAPGIEAEALLEMSLTESLPESHKSHTSPRGPGTTLGAPPQPAAMFSEKVIEVKHRKRATPSPRKRRPCSPEARHSSSPGTAGTDSSECRSQTPGPGRLQRTPGARSKAAGPDGSRQRPLSHPTPDFSKVEPRVRFPKGGYKPPKSRRSSRGELLPPELPLVFTSPVDIVKEVLLNVPRGSPATPDPCRPAASAAVFAVPQEFRCRQHAITLLEQLQEDYNTLLTKYAEAENTIDRLRLEAKVNLYSDPPKPGHTLQSGLKQEASRLMLLDFPQAQRAEMSSASPHASALSAHQESSPVPPSTTSPDPQLGQPANILYSQAEQFLQQLQTFEDLLEQKKLKPVQRVKGLLQLAEALDSLESGYLLVREEQKPLQQGDAQMSHFDPERELEGLIFQFGQHMDELREQVGQTQQDPPTCEAPPSPHPHHTPSPVPTECGEAQAQPQSSSEPSLVDPGEAAGVEVSSASEEETENGDTENSLTLNHLNGKHRRDEDSATRADQYQSFRELHKRSSHSQKEATPPPAAVRADGQPGREERERRRQRTGNQEVQRVQSLPQRKSDREDSPPPCTRGQRAHRSSPVSSRAPSQATTVPDDPPTSRRKFKVRPSHSSSLSSLGEITALERRSSSLQTGSSGALSQEGIISPEMDSGFIGSESSRRTPAAAPSPRHQRASKSVPAPQEGNPVKPGTDPVSAPSPASSPSHGHTAVEDSLGSQLSPDQPRRSRRVRRRRSSSCSPQRRGGQTDRSRSDGGISGFKLERDSSDSVSEGGQNESVDSLHSSSLSSFLDSPRRGRARGCSHVTYRNDAIQTLQHEVRRLREKLERCLRNTTPRKPVRSAQTDRPLNRTFTARIRSRERVRDISGGRGDEEEEDTVRRAAVERPPSPHRRDPRPSIMTASEPTVPRPKPLVSRCTQTSSAASDASCTRVDAVPRRAHTRQDPVEVCEAADEPDSGRHPARLCPQCLSRHRWQPEGGNDEATRSCLHCCPRGTESGSPTNTSRQPAQSPDGGLRRTFAAGAPPALLRCMSVSAPPLLLYSLPLCVSPSNNAVPSSGGRGRREARRRPRRSRSTDEQRFVDDSLDRAIRAARHMRLTSGHMARSLADWLD